MTFDQKWIEYDFNPFILFNVSGKIVSLNTEAQYLLGATDASSIFKIATLYANSTFGFKTTFIELEFGRFKFFGLTVGYEDEEQIGIRLYQLPSFQFTKKKPQGQLVNIYTLIDLCISANSINNPVEFVKQLDPTIPEIRIQTELFIKLLNKIYVSMIENTKILTNLFFRVGEHIKFDNEKYSLFSIEISSDNINRKFLPEITKLAEDNHLFIDIKEKRISINIPMITK